VKNVKERTDKKSCDTKVVINPNFISPQQRTVQPGLAENDGRIAGEKVVSGGDSKARAIPTRYPARG
jgi:hypothetical protein